MDRVDVAMIARLAGIVALVAGIYLSNAALAPATDAPMRDARMVTPDRCDAPPAVPRGPGEAVPCPSGQG